RSPATRGETMAEHHDLVVIGSGPGGQRAAIQAAKLGKRAVVIEKSDQVGGAALRAGTIPTQAAREAVLALTAAPAKGLLGGTGTILRNVPFEDVFTATSDVVAAQLRVVESALARNQIAVIRGAARFADPRTVLVAGADGERALTADRFVIATGTRAARPGHV